MKRLILLIRKYLNRNWVFIEEQHDFQTGRIVELWQNKKTGQNKIIH